MQIEKDPPDFCNICHEKNMYRKQYSSLFKKQIYLSHCINNHTHQYPIKYIEVCPICQNIPILINQQTKTCKYNHSWLKCKRCNYVTISNKKQRILYCKKCIYPQKKYCNCFTWISKLFK